MAKFRRGVVLLLAVGLALSGCATLPSSGPTAGQINSALRNDNQTGFTIVDIDPAIAATLASSAPSDGGLGTLARSGRIDTLGPGDILTVDVYEVGVTLFTGASSPSQGSAFNPSARGTTLDNVLVDGQGNITLPYVGRLNVDGKTPSELAKSIERGLRGLSQRPQVQVTVKNNAHNVYYVLGDVRSPGRFALALPEERLLDALARAGGTEAKPDDVILRLTRDGRSAETRLSAVAPAGPQNVALMPGDRVELFTRPRTYLVFGSAPRVAQESFGTNDLSLAEAVARIGGPNESAANPAAVYLFRYEYRADTTPGTASGEQPVIYRLNMLKPDSYFLSQRIGMRDKDVIYIASAASNQPGKLAQILGQLFSPILAVRSVTR